MKWSKPVKRFFQEYIFTNLFDYSYKAHDTYKDKDGKGILERFVNICSEYLDNDVMPDIDNFMDSLDADTANPIFLNYLWEFFGYIPYAYGVLNYGEPYTQENLERWLKEDRGYPTARYREVLKYAISLYKIRGTKKFFDVLGRFYNITIELTDLSTSRYGDDFRWPSSLHSIAINYDESMVQYDSEDINFDTKLDCWECVPMSLSLGIPINEYERFSTEDKKIQDQLIEQWKSDHIGYTQSELEQAIRDIVRDHPHDFTDKVKKSLVDIVNKYLPINVKFFDPSSSEVVMNPNWDSTIQTYATLIIENK